MAKEYNNEGTITYKLEVGMKGGNAANYAIIFQGKLRKYLNSQPGLDSSGLKMSKPGEKTVLHISIPTDNIGLQEQILKYIRNYDSDKTYRLQCSVLDVKTEKQNELEERVDKLTQNLAIANATRRSQEAELKSYEDLLEQAGREEDSLEQRKQAAETYAQQAKDYEELAAVAESKRDDAREELSQLTQGIGYAELLKERGLPHKETILEQPGLLHHLVQMAISSYQGENRPISEILGEMANDRLDAESKVLILKKAAEKLTRR